MYTDMWSMGVLFYVLLQGNYPFRAKSENGLFEKIRNGQYEYIHEDITEKSRMLIQQLLRVNPLERLTSEQVAPCIMVVDQSPVDVVVQRMNYVFVFTATFSK
jgi:serine/threonine protein kinase